MISFFKFSKYIDTKICACPVYILLSRYVHVHVYNQKNLDSWKVVGKSYIYMFNMVINNQHTGTVSYTSIEDFGNIYSILVH